MWTCELAWKPGYRKSCFRAMAAPPGGKRRPIGESRPLRWTLMADPEPPTRELVEAARELVKALQEAGWERTGAAGAWWEQRFLWRGDGEPGTIEDPGPKRTPT
jgi:hypothetical protein